MGRPYAVIDDQAVDAAQGVNRRLDESPAVVHAGKFLFQGDAAVRRRMRATTLRNERFSGRGRGVVAERDLRSGAVEEADGCRSDSP